MQTAIFITARFVHFHRWPTAPDLYAYLRDLHRHEFHVRMEIPVTELNREIEFIAFKDRVKTVLAANSVGAFPPYDPNIITLDWSCEHWCEFLMATFPQASFCEVSEDGENGACMFRSLDEIDAAMAQVEETLRQTEDQDSEEPGSTLLAGQPQVPSIHSGL